MAFNIKFFTTKEEFGDEFSAEEINRPYLKSEIIQILQKISDDIKSGKTGGPILDIKGRKIGFWET